MRRKLAVVRWGGANISSVLAPTGDTLIASREAPPRIHADPPPDGSNEPGCTMRRLLRLAPLLAFAAFVTPEALPQTISVDLGTGQGLDLRHRADGGGHHCSVAGAIDPGDDRRRSSGIVVVLSLLRTAIGLQNAPPNSVVISLSLFLTAFVMAPTFMQSYEQGIQPYMAEAITLEEAIPRALGPVQQFMGRHANAERCRPLRQHGQDREPQEPRRCALPGAGSRFMISELKRAFEIGFMVFLPFLVIDLVVSSILMAMGMMMLPPVSISLPFKLIFFVLVDGWRMLAGSLVESFMQNPPS